MSKPEKKLCSICGAELPRGELGFSPEPYKPYTSGTCCIKCYRDKVLPLRVKKRPQAQAIGLSEIRSHYNESRQECISI